MLLGDSGATQRYIKTVRGRGVRFEADVREQPGEREKGVADAAAKASIASNALPSLLMVPFRALSAPSEAARWVDGSSRSPAMAVAVNADANMAVTTTRPARVRGRWIMCFSLPFGGEMNSRRPCEPAAGTSRVKPAEGRAAARASDDPARRAALS